MFNKKIFYFLTTIPVLFNLGCATQSKNPQDPLEGLNREIYGFNRTLDKAFIKPIAYAYDTYLPDPLQRGINNFFTNLHEITNVANDIFQFKFAYAAHDASRFFINSTLGIFGLFDIASEVGLDLHREDFGQTLYTWGYKKSIYFVIPIFGPSTIRDSIGLLADYTVLSVWPWVDRDTRYLFWAVNFIDERANLLEKEKVLETIAIDEYVVVRDAYLQRREYLFKGEDERGGVETDPYALEPPIEEETDEAFNEEFETEIFEDDEADQIMDDGLEDEIFEEDDQAMDDGLEDEIFEEDDQAMDDGLEDEIFEEDEENVEVTEVKEETQGG